jgi:hypothetical protein
MKNQIILTVNKSINTNKLLVGLYLITSPITQRHFKIVL